MDTLHIGRFGVVCWSGGGPTSYRLSATYPDKVSALVAIAAVSGPYRFGTGLAGIESSLMASGFGGWVLHQMAEHSPKSLIRSTLKEEGRLSHQEIVELAAHVWEHPEKSGFVLKLSATLSDRNAGLHNDQDRFPELGGLGLDDVTVPTLLVHGTADADVDIEHSERALAVIEGAEIQRVEKGTHLCTWTDPTSSEIQARIADHLAG